MIVVVDTNALIQVFGTRSPFIRLQQAILDGQVTLAVSTPILLEYEEVMTRYGGPDRWPRVWRTLEMTDQLHNNLRRIAPAFRWQLIAADPDDNPFADCAIAAKAEWIITENGHFNVLKDSGHKPQPITPAEFSARFLAAT